MSDPKPRAPDVVKTITISAGTAEALDWMVRNEIDISQERLLDLKIEDALSEVSDIGKVVDLLRQAGGAEMEKFHEIEADLRNMRSRVAKRAQQEDPNSRLSIEAEARVAYHAVVGSVILATEVECYDDNSVSVTAVCDPPAVLRVTRYDSEASIRDNVLRWMDDQHMDPVYNIEVLEAHPAFEGLRASWIYGTGRSTEGKMDPGRFKIADAAQQAAYRGAKALTEEQYAPRSAAPGM